MASSTHCPDTASLRDRLVAVVGYDRVSTGPAELLTYSYDGTFQQRVPDFVVAPERTEQVAAVLAAANELGVPVVPRGASSGLAGGTIPESGGVVLNLAGMRRIVEVDAANGVAVVEPGVITADLQAAVERVGLFYPPDPASLQQSTIGGNVNTNAGGPRCLKYGATRDYVLGLTVALVDGRVLRLGGKVVKSSTGYQLVQLFVGSEGTLGVVTEAILKLLPLPGCRATAMAIFPRLDDAGVAVTRLLTSGILPVAVELMDQTTINLVEDHTGMGLPRAAEALLLLEQDGNDAAAALQDVERMADICRSSGASEVQVARDTAERDRLWAARRAVSPALGRVAPNKLGEDIVVPRAAVPEMIRRVRQIAEEHRLTIPIFGHAGDGNLHPNVLFDRRRDGELERVEGAAAAIFRAALELGGTLSGEHGIGTLKREFMEEALGAEVVGLMRGVKRLLDPKGILNPGKKLPSGRGESGFLSTLPALDGLVPG